MSIKYYVCVYFYLCYPECNTHVPYYIVACMIVDSSWNVMAHGDAREGKWRGNWRMEWVSSTLHTTSEHGVSSMTTADAHTSAASSRLNWRPPADLNGLVLFARKTKSGFCACDITFQTQCTTFLRILINGTTFGRSFWKLNVCAFSINIFFWNTSHSKKNSVRYHRCTGWPRSHRTPRQYAPQTQYKFTLHSAASSTV
jgi:hypothetical protein